MQKICIFLLALCTTNVLNAAYYEKYDAHSCAQQLLNMTMSFVGRPEYDKKWQAQEILSLVKKCPGDFDKQAQAAAHFAHHTRYPTLQALCENYAFQACGDAANALKAAEQLRRPQLFLAALTCIAHKKQKKIWVPEGNIGVPG